MWTAERSLSETPRMPVRVAAVIPARMASHRFPGKPLLSIRGLPLGSPKWLRAMVGGA
ncbi:MAG: hypothetical protein HYW10_02310 [Candidatus Omnitrophica bacterium]|nr:hypothetical protein [Candidatus Omnitrophota bacterium]